MATVSLGSHLPLAASFDSRFWAIRAVVGAGGYAALKHNGAGLIYVPEPTSVFLLAIGFAIGLAIGRGRQPRWQEKGSFVHKVSIGFATLDRDTDWQGVIDRFGKVFVTESGSAWNLYGEIRKTVYHSDEWRGSVLDTALRVNLSYAFPM